jgi:DNA mismatch repair protein MutS2
VRVVRDGQVLHGPATADDRAIQHQEAAEEQYVEAETRDIAVGDRVKLRSFGTIGIVDSIKEDEAEVRVKSLRFREKLNNLQLVESTGPAKAPVSRFAKLRASSAVAAGFQGSTEAVSSELNVIGQTTDEAVDSVDKFLDEAFMNSLNEIRIVHGHGTGALRRAIAEFLKNHPHVERFLPASPEHGGAGATVVDLKR